MLRVVGERPGVTTRELAAASGVRGGTLYALLRTLTQRGELEKRELPGGQTGHVLAASPPAAAAPPPTPATTVTEPIPAAMPTPAADENTDGDDATSAPTAASPGEADARSDPGRNSPNQDESSPDAPTGGSSQTPRSRTTEQ